MSVRALRLAAAQLRAAAAMLCSLLLALQLPYAMSAAAAVLPDGSSSLWQQQVQPSPLCYALSPSLLSARLCSSLLLLLSVRC